MPRVKPPAKVLSKKIQKALALEKERFKARRAARKAAEARKRAKRPPSKLAKKWQVKPLDVERPDAKLDRVWGNRNFDQVFPKFLERVPKAERPYELKLLVEQIKELVLNKIRDLNERHAEHVDSITNPIDPQHLPPGMQLNEQGQIVTAPVQAETIEDLFSVGLMSNYDDC